MARHALVVGADVMSSIIDYTDRTTCVLFGDGAGAAVVSASPGGGLGLIDFTHEVDGSGGPALCMPAGGSKLPASHETVDKRLHYVHQDGQSVFRFAVRKNEEVCRRLLERNGMNVLTAKDGVDAIAQLQEQKPDIMLLDIEMPRMDGFEVATLVRHDPQLADLPIIMITSRTGEKHRERAISIGVNDYLGKPYQEAQLLERIHALVDRP